MVREEYFPTITQVNKKDVQALMQINSEFRSFMEALVKHKVNLGQVNTKTPLMQAVNTVSMCLKQRGGGFKIPQEVKDYFIHVLGARDFNQDIIEELGEDEQFKSMYSLMRKRYSTKHLCDLSIRQFVKASRK